MTNLTKPILERVYTATSDSERQSAYDEWATDYDGDLNAFGYTVPSVGVGVISRFVDPDEGPVLDAGCGTGLIGTYLHYLGYGPITGIDLSSGMIDVARSKNAYENLIQMRLGDRLDFPDGTFAAAVSFGTFTPGHAGAEAFAELCRVTKTGGRLIFSLRLDGGNGQDYLDALDELSALGVVERRHVSNHFPALPIAEPEVIDRIFVYNVR